MYVEKSVLYGKINIHMLGIWFNNYFYLFKSWQSRADVPPDALQVRYRPLGDGDGKGEGGSVLCASGILTHSVRQSVSVVSRRWSVRPVTPVESSHSCRSSTTENIRRNKRDHALRITSVRIVWQRHFTYGKCGNRC